jgi:hypothetical protein
MGNATGNIPRTDTKPVGSPTDTKSIRGPQTPSPRPQDLRHVRHRVQLSRILAWWFAKAACGGGLRRRFAKAIKFKTVKSQTHVPMFVVVLFINVMITRHDLSLHQLFIYHNLCSPSPDSTSLLLLSAQDQQQDQQQEVSPRFLPLACLPAPSYFFHLFPSLFPYLGGLGVFSASDLVSVALVPDLGSEYSLDLVLALRSSSIPRRSICNPFKGLRTIS